MTSNRTRVGLCAAAALLAARPVCSATDEQAALVVLTLEDQANAIWSGVPEDPSDPRVTVLGGATRECSAEALRRAKDALAQAGGGRMALRTLALDLSVPRSVLNDLARGRAAADAMGPFVTAGTRSDHVEQPLGGSGCEDGAAFYDLRAAEGAAGRLALHMLAEGTCGCGTGGSGAGRVRFHLVGEAAVEPGIVERKNVLRLRAAPPRFSVLAACGSCADETARRPAQPVKGDPCGPPCAPLANGFAAWQQEANQAAAKVTDLAAKATTLELDISTQRRELDAAQAGARKPRAVLERISALQDRIKAAQAELSRVTRASQEIQKYLDAARQASDQTRAADQRCQSQCRARTERSPQKEASAGQGTAGTAGGGGVSSGVLIGGGAALVAGGVAVATLGKGDDDAPPAGPVSFAGNWVGTRTTTATVNQPGCTRVFDEAWVISQNGTVLRADITARAQGCGPQPACGPCQVFSFPRFHNGSVDGTTARFFVFPELEVPSCVLPLRLQGDTLSGAMPACDTGATDTLSDVVTLRRSGP